MRFRSSSGFTLIELMIVVAIVGILLLVVTPNFGRFVADSRVSTTKDKLVSSMALARTEAIKRGESVVVCRANAAGNNCANAGTDWSNGWLVFADLNADSDIDNDDVVVRIQADIDNQVTVTYAQNTPIRYNGRGTLILAAAADQTFAISDAADNTIGAGLSVRSTGRVRSCADWDASSKSCKDN